MKETFHAQNFREENELRLICFQLDDHPWISIQRTVFSMFTSWLFGREQLGAQGYLLKSLHGQRFGSTSTSPIIIFKWFTPLLSFPIPLPAAPATMKKVMFHHLSWNWRGQFYMTMEKFNPLKMYFPLKTVSSNPPSHPGPLKRTPEVGYVTTKCPKARFLLDLIDNWDLPRCGSWTMQRCNKGGP